MKKLLMAEIYKLKISREYKFFIISCFISAIISVIFIKVLELYIHTISYELIARMRFNNMYNFGFFQIGDIQALNDMTSFTVISSAFRNYTPTVGVAAFVSIFIKKEFSSGGMRNFLLRGYERKNVLFAKFTILLAGIILAIALYLIGYVFAAVILFDTQDMFRYPTLQTFIFFGRGILIHLSFATICFMTSICMSKNSLVIIMNASAVVAGTMFINNLLVLSSGRYDLSRFWILDYLAELSPSNGVDNFQLYFISILTLSFSYLIANAYFNKLQFE